MGVEGYFVRSSPEVRLGSPAGVLMMTHEVGGAEIAWACLLLFKPLSFHPKEIRW